MKTLTESFLQEDEELGRHNKKAIIDYGIGETKRDKRVYPLAWDCPFYEAPIESHRCTQRKCWVLFDMMPQEILKRQTLREYDRQKEYEAGYGGSARRHWERPESRQQIDQIHSHKTIHY